ncbi:taste receptor type 2 member 8-like [Paroedura picta]|uniref:taste receptor type 2 member 8-like n=1 Tax=Paroedura picta TaxID=143630 RepID=UPI0040578C63
MATVLIVSFVFLVVETLTGLVANGSIVLIHFIDWFRSRKLSPTDLILTCLGLARLLLQAIMILGITLFVLLKVSQNNVLFPLTGIWKFTNSLNLWFAACLSVFYLAKIAIFSHPLFLRVKQRLPGLVPWLLLGSATSSAVKTIIVNTAWGYGSSTCSFNISPVSNRSHALMNISGKCLPFTTLYTALDIVPIMVFLSSTAFLISSLWKHMRSMQQTGTGTRDLNTQAHMTAIKALGSFAVLYLIYIAMTTLQSILVWKTQLTWTVMLLTVNV